MKKHFKNDANIEIVEIADLPLFSEDAPVPIRIREIAHAIEESDGVIISTPEYDHSITASLKSVIEWLSYGALHPFTNVPVMIVGTSLGKMGTVFAQEHLRQIMNAPGLDAYVLPGNQFVLGPAAANFDENDNLSDPGTVKFLEIVFQNFITYMETVRPMRALAVDRTGGGKLAKQQEAGDGWRVEEVNLGYGSATDVFDGSPLDVDAMPALINPDDDADIIEQGDGWWIEATRLTDAVVTSVIVSAVDDEEDSTTGASIS
jgi:NAD(P)H-dependent FMN reductase